MLTTFAYFGYEIPKKQALEMIKHAGFDGVTLWWSDEFGDANFRGNPALARNIGLFLENVHASFVGVNDLWLDNLDGDALGDYFFQVIDECAEHEIPAVILHLSTGHNPPPFNEIGLERFKKIIERAEQKNVNVAFENLKQADYLDYVLSRVDSPRAGFCYDSGHHHSWHPPEDLFSKFGSRLMALHLHDNDGTGDQHLLPFDGTIDWPGIMKKISQTGYTGAISMETINTGYVNLPPEEFLRMLFERAKRLEGLM